MQEEKNKRWYHACYTVHPTTGQPIQEALDSIEGKPFGEPVRKSGDGKFIVFNCVDNDEFNSHSELEGFVIDPDDPDFAFGIGLQETCWHVDTAAETEANGWDARVEETHTLTDPANFHHCLAKKLLAHAEFVAVP